MSQTQHRDAGGQGGPGEATGDFETAFYLAKHAIAHASTAAFARHGIYEGQQFVLRRLWQQDGLSPGELARQLGLATPTVTRAATRMEAAGLLRREPHTTDRRLIRLCLTDRARALEPVLNAELHAITDRALAGLGDAERATFISVLRRVHRNLTAE